MTAPYRPRRFRLVRITDNGTTRRHYFQTLGAARDAFDTCNDAWLLERRDTYGDWLLVASRKAGAA